MLILIQLPTQVPSPEQRSSYHVAPAIPQVAGLPGECQTRQNGTLLPMVLACSRLSPKFSPAAAPMERLVVN